MEEVKNFKLVIWNYGSDGEVRALYDENEKLIMGGDYYHDKIEYQIQGFIECLKHLKVKYKINKLKKKSEDPYNEM